MPSDAASHAFAAGTVTDSFSVSMREGLNARRCVIPPNNSVHSKFLHWKTLPVSEDYVKP